MFYSTLVKVFLFCFIFFLGTASVEAGGTGRSAAMKYFTYKKKESSTRSPSSKETKENSPFESPGQSLLAFSVGSLINNKTYGQFNSRPLWSSEIFYQSHRGSYVANAFHLEWQQFPRSVDRLNKLSFLFSLSFPRSISFPVFIGLATGPGFFMKSGNKKSVWTIDSRVYLGLRLTRTRSQYFLQTGFKNHLLEFKNVELPGWFISLGLAYRF